MASLLQTRLPQRVIDEAIRLNEEGVPCPLAIETSGHAALKENHFLDDGMYLATLLFIEAMKQKKLGLKLRSLISTLKEPVESKEIRLRITDPDFRLTGERILADLLNYAQRQAHWHIAPDNHEGVRISFDLKGGQDNSWFLLRLSVHDPVMPLNLEGDVSGGIHVMLNELLGALQAAEGIDLHPVKAELTELYGEN